MNQICKDIGSYGLVPVIKIDDPDKAVPLAKALCDGAQSLRPEQFDEVVKGVDVMLPLVNKVRR